MDEHPAPAMDAAGNEVWNIWTTPKNGREEIVITVYSYAACMRVCDAMERDGYTVLTDAI